MRSECRMEGLDEEKSRPPLLLIASTSRKWQESPEREGSRSPRYSCSPPGTFLAGTLISLPLVFKPSPWLVAFDCSNKHSLCSSHKNGHERIACFLPGFILLVLSIPILCPPTNNRLLVFGFVFVFNK